MAAKKKPAKEKKLSWSPRKGKRKLATAAQIAAGYKVPPPKKEHGKIRVLRYVKKNGDLWETDMVRSGGKKNRRVSCKPRKRGRKK